MVPPQDRDSAAVVAALRRIDACALVDRAVASRAGFGAHPAVYPEAPHTCTVSSVPSSGNDEVQIRLGAQVEHFHKWGAAPITLAGVKAYLQDESLERNHCAIYLPVSFTRAIWIGTQWGTSTRSIPDLCAVTKSFAVAAVVRLVADPESLLADRRTLPLSEWDGCSLLAGALSDAAGQYTVTLDEGVPGIDGCEASAGEDRKLTLKVSYRWDPATDAGATRKQIGGRTASILELVLFGGEYLGCVVKWSNGSATGIRVFSDQVLGNQGTGLCTGGRIGRRRDDDPAHRPSIRSGAASPAVPAGRAGHQRHRSVHRRLRWRQARLLHAVSRSARSG